MSNPPQIIRTPNPLRAKLGGFGGIDSNAVARAEAALKAMSAQFEQWLQDEVTKMTAAQTAIREQGLSAETAEALYFRAHDLKGLGTTYNYPIVTRMAASLCRLLDDPSKRLTAPQAIVDAHVDGIRAVVRDQISTDEHPVGRELVEALEAKVQAHMAEG